MKTLLNLSAILFCAMLVSCNHKREARQDESSPDEPSKIVNADNTGTDVDPANRNGKSPIEPNVTPAEATVHMVIPREYFAEYERDEVAFTDKYKDGAIEMTGKAIMVGNAFDSPFIKLDVGRDETTGVHCFTKDKQPWAIVVPGQQVTLRGKLPSRLFGAQVQDCDILETGPSPAIKIDAAALASEYAADPNACSEKYKEKYLYVDGTVEAIDTKTGIVHLAGNDGVRIRCKFDTYGEKEQIPSLKPGDQVHVIGHYIGAGGGANEVLLTLCLLYDPSQIKPVPALKADSKRAADTTTVLAKYPDDFRPNASGHADSSGHGKWFYQASEAQNPSSPEANLRQLSWDEGRKRYESPLRGKNNTFPSIDQRMHPSPDQPHFAVLRWQSLDSASIRVRGNFSKLADAKQSNGVRALVFVDGEQVFDQEVGPRDAQGVDFDFAALVKPDSVVDFVVDPKQDAYWDSTKLIVTIEQSVLTSNDQRTGADEDDASVTVDLQASPEKSAGMLKLEELGATIDLSGDAVSVGMSNIEIRDEDLVHLKEVPNITSLNLNYTGVTDAGIQHISGLTSLTELGLSNAKITDDSLKILASFAELAQLDLTSCHGVSNAGLVHLKSLKKLTELTLPTYPRITDDGVANVVELSNLVRLDVHNTGITDKGLESLAGLNKLEFINLLDTKVTSEGVAKFKEKHPACEVRSNF